LTPEQGLTAAKTGWSGVKAWVEYWRAGRIQITSPRPRELLEGKEPFELQGRFSYTVRGTLKRLPRDHEIWLLIEDRSGYVWPQGFSRVQYNQQTGEWFGRVHTQFSEPTIIAVVAPPTSVDFFRYYQKVGNKTNHEALTRVPVECTNRTTVQARVAPA
jgi:hypothetical protein